jgi:hypothetical protein
MTWKQVGIAFLAIMLFMAGWTVILLAAIEIPPRVGLSDTGETILVLSLALLTVLSFQPFFYYVVRSVFFFKGEGQAISKAELHVRLHERRHEAILTESTRKVNWGVGVEGVRLGWSGFRGVVSEWERGETWGIRENFAPGKLYDYTFTPSLVTNPVINTILRSGWDVRFSIF